MFSRTQKGLTLTDANDGSSVTISSNGVVEKTLPVVVVDTPPTTDAPVAPDAQPTTKDASTTNNSSDASPSTQTPESQITTTPNTSAFADKQFTTALGMQGPLNLTPVNLG
ncbi:MAG: hypothetical protein PHE67_05960, partial [Campylobacterales bacterium]|nr:hypothetical protein [Campylobacterales bacterium]